MSVEAFAIIVSAASLLVTIGGGLFAGFAWVLRRMDEHSGKIDEKFIRVDDKFAKVDDKFAKVDDRLEKMQANLDHRFDRISAQLSGLQTELNEVKVSVARLEGPPPRLILPR